MINFWLITKFGLKKAILINCGLKIGVLLVAFVGAYLYYKSKE